MSRNFDNVWVTMKRIFSNTFILPMLLVVMLAAPTRSMAAESMAVLMNLILNWDMQGGG